MNRDIVDLAVFALFVVFVAAVISGSPLGWIGVAVCGVYLCAASARDLRLERNKVKWLASRAVVASALLVVRRIKTGQWF